LKTKLNWTSRICPLFIAVGLLKMTFGKDVVWSRSFGEGIDVGVSEELFERENKGK